MHHRCGGLEPGPGDDVELRIVDAAVARALFEGIPAARVLARVRLGQRAGGAAWDTHLRKLVREDPVAYDRVKRSIARHARAAVDEGLLAASEATTAALFDAVASLEDADASLAEIAQPDADKRAPAFEACAHLATRASLGPMRWERLRAIAAQLEREQIGVHLFDRAAASFFPHGVDVVAPGDARMAPLDRRRLDALVSKDPRQLAGAVWKIEQLGGGAHLQLATFLADLARLLARPGTLVVAIAPSEPPEDAAAVRGSAPSWAPAGWSPATAEALADALERGATTFARVRAAAMRGGEAALDALGAEMLRVTAHPVASAAFADVLASSSRPRDVVRLVTYFALAPDPAPAARALGACAAVDLPRVLGAWLEAMLPADGGGPRSSGGARVSACVASLRPYPHLYRAVQPLLRRV
jgi:hypothetical protein